MPNYKLFLVANTDWYLFNFRLSLGKFLQNHGFEVVFVSPYGEYVREISKNGFRYIEWNVGRRSMGLFSEFKSLLSLIKIYTSEKPNLVHHFTIKPVLYGSIAARYTKVKAIVNSITGLGYIFLNKELKGRIFKFFLLPVYKFALRNSNNHIIFENQNDRDVFMVHGLLALSSNSIIQGVGVDENYFVPTPEPILDVPLIVFPARLLYDKGVKTLVDAIRILKPEVKIRVALVGDIDPGNPSSIDELIIRNWVNEDLVEWWGFRKDMLSVYQSCNIVTLPSLGEGLPTVLIEAASCGRAIVATDVAGCRDVVENGVNGILVPPNNPKALAEAILNLVNNPEKRQLMGIEGRRMVHEKFTSQSVNTQTLVVYRNLL